MSRVLLLNFEDFGLSQDLSKTIQPHKGFCICCLDRNGPMVDLDKCAHKDYLDAFNRPQLQQYNKLVCLPCHSILKKIKCFQMQVLDSFNILLSGTFTNTMIKINRSNSLIIQKVVDDLHLPPDSETTPEIYDKSDSAEEIYSQQISSLRENYTQELNMTNAEENMMCEENQDNFTHGIIASSNVGINYTRGIRNSHLEEHFIQGVKVDLNLEKEYARNSSNLDRNYSNGIRDSSLEGNFNLVPKNNSSLDINYTRNSSNLDENYTELTRDSCLEEKFNHEAKDTSVDMNYTRGSSNIDENYTNGIRDSSLEENFNHVTKVNTSLDINYTRHSSNLDENYTDGIRDSSLEENFSLGTKDNSSLDINYTGDSSNLDENYSDGIRDSSLDETFSLETKDDSSLDKNYSRDCSNLNENYTNGIRDSPLEENFTHGINYDSSLDKNYSHGIKDNFTHQMENREQDFTNCISNEHEFAQQHNNLNIEENKNIKTALDILERNNHSFVTLGSQLQFLNGEHLSFLEPSLLSKEILTDIPVVPAKILSTDLDNALLHNSKSLDIEIDVPDKIFYDSLDLSPGLLVKDTNLSEMIKIGIDEHIKHNDIEPNINTDFLKPNKVSKVKKKITPIQVKVVKLSQEQLNRERVLLAQSDVYLRHKFRCETCLIGFNFEENLEDHRKRKHGMREPNNVVCEICCQVVSTMGSITAHNYRHYTRYECPHCSRRYQTRDEAIQHCIKNVCGKGDYRNSRNPTTLPRRSRLKFQNVRT